MEKELKKMTEWILLIFLIISGMGVIICTIQLKDYQYPSQIHEEIIKEFRCDDE